MEETKKVLLVEDDAGFRNAIAECFESTELSLVTAVDGEEGLVKIREEKPDLILLDILLPKLDGVAMAKKLREGGDDTPIIFLTNVKNDDKISEAMEVTQAKADYIVKTDVRVDDIIERIKKRLNLK